MFILNPFFIGGIAIFAFIFLVAIALWIVYGIKKFKWVMIASIVLSAVFILTAGMFCLRIVSGKMVGSRIIGNGRAFDHFPKIERIIDKKDIDIFRQRGFFDLKGSLRSRRPEIRVEGLEIEKRVCKRRFY